MKYASLLLAVSLLTGCAGMTTQPEPPSYDYSQRAILAPGFPVERIELLPGYVYANGQSKRSTNDHASASEQGQNRLQRSVYALSGNDYRLATIYLNRTDANSRFTPLTNSEDYEFVAGEKVSYLFRRGVYRDVVDFPALIPEGAPQCAYATDIAITSRDRRHRYVVSLANGVACNAPVSDRDRQAQRETAYRIANLR